MKTNLGKLSLLFLFSCGLLMSCARDELVTGGCQSKQFKGILTIERIDSKFDGRHNLRTAYGTFIADNTDAPKSLKPAKVKRELGYPENSNVTISQKYYAEVSYVISGPCPDEPLLDSPQNWKEVE